MTVLYGLAGAVVALVVLVWLGLKVRPASFSLFPQRTPDLLTVPLREGLPEPVARFFHTLYGDRVPLLASAMITGRATLRIKGITFPSRFRFTHDAGRGYRHYIESTFFGLPLMRVNERFLDGRGRMETPFGVVEGQPKVDQGGNLALWGEAFWFPALLATDTRVQWEALDENTAVMVVPGTDDVQERFVVRFDPANGLPTVLEAMRYKDAESAAKTLWLDEVLEWGVLSGCPTFTVGRVTWFDDKLPWAEFRAEDVILNADVSEYIRARGL